MLERVHFSTLKHMQRSPAHYQAALSDDSAQLGHQRTGTSLHSFLIGAAESVVQYDGRRDKRMQAYRDFCEEHVGKVILSAKEHAQASGMRDSICRSRQAVELLAGQREQGIEWSWLGRTCAGTPDVFSLEHLTELKSCRTAQPERFMSSARFYGYHAQLAWYRRALIECGFGTPASYWIVAVESARPFPVTVFRMTDNALDLGERMCRAWMERLLVCESSDAWPAYAESPVPFDVSEDDGFTLRIDGEDVEIE